MAKPLFHNFQEFSDTKLENLLHQFYYKKNVHNYTLLVHRAELHCYVWACIFTIKLQVLGQIGLDKQCIP